MLIMIFFRDRQDMTNIIDEDNFLRKCRDPASYQYKSKARGHIFRNDVVQFMNYFGHLLGNYQPNKKQIHIPQMVNVI